MEEKLLTVADVAELLQIKKTTVYKLVYEKRIPVLKISSKMLRFRKQDIDEWIQKCLHNTKQTITHTKQTITHTSHKKIDKQQINKIIEQAKKEILR